MLQLDFLERSSSELFAVDKLKKPFSTCTCFPPHASSNFTLILESNHSRFLRYTTFIALSHTFHGTDHRNLAYFPSCCVVCCALSLFYSISQRKNSWIFVGGKFFHALPCDRPQQNYSICLARIVTQKLLPSQCCLGRLELQNRIGFSFSLIDTDQN